LNAQADTRVVISNIV